jgi:hypothetical protein
LKFLSVPAISGNLSPQQNTWLPWTSLLYCQICSWVPFHVFTQNTHKNCAINAVFLMLYYILECKKFSVTCFSIVACIGCLHSYLFSRTNLIMEPCSIYAVLNFYFALVWKPSPPPETTAMYTMHKWVSWVLLTCWIYNRKLQLHLCVGITWWEGGKCPSQPIYFFT